MVPKEKNQEIRLGAVFFLLVLIAQQGKEGPAKLLVLDLYVPSIPGGSGTPWLILSICWINAIQTV